MDGETDISADITLLFSLLSEAAKATAEGIGSFVFVFVGEGFANAVATGIGTKVFFYELMQLMVENIDMKAGDTLIIDSEHMVVTLNGVNVVDKVTDDSIFFDLKPGLNELTISPIKASSSSATIKVLWKDRWI